MLEEAVPIRRLMSGKPMDAATAQRMEEVEKQRIQREKEMEERQKALRISDCIRDLADNVGRRYHPKAASLEKYQVYHKAQQPVLDKLRELVPRLPELVKEGRGLIFYGPCGSGKDHLAIALLYELARGGIKVRWLNGRDIFGAFRDRIDSRERDEDYFRSLCVPDVLAISDPLPPHGNVGDWNLENLYRLVDRRYRQRQSIWVTLNVATVEEADARLSAPVFDRLRHDAEIFGCFWPSFRERK
jgi:DNA replication protein DnaC